MDGSGVEDGVPGGRVRPCPGCGLADRVAGVPAVHQEGRGSVLEMSGVGDRRTLRPADTGLSRALAPAPARSYAPLGFACASVMTLLATVVLAAFGLFGTVAEHGYERFRGAVAERNAAGEEEPEPSSTWITGEDGTPLLVTGPDEGLWGEDGSVTEEGSTFETVPVPPSAEDSGLDDLLVLPWAAAGVMGAGTVLLTVLAVRKQRENARVRAGRPVAERIWARGWYCRRCGTVHFPDAEGAQAEPLQLAEFRHLVWSEGGYGHLAARRG
ncbi:hypothetical protein [Streptomyces fragilis]|uniref:Integral membrane protein n=1 Tax=Streptomyces fragilis TaxID=67301 RepID=A0ABV2YH78_9ACTN|nr:hypothetical protein [Streptomyces fragilis]